MPGEGSVYQRADGKWVAQLSFGPRGDRRYRRKLASSKRAALVALDVLKIEAKDDQEPSRRSLSSYLRWWLDETVGENLTPNTIRGYSAAIEHFAPIGHIPLADLRAEHIEAVCRRMRATRYMGPNRPMRDLGPASPKTVRNAQLMLRAALQVAYERGQVRRNEAKLVRLAKVPRLTRPPMTPAIARAILDAIAGDRYEAAYALGMAALRESEILGLSRRDVDLEARTVTIRHQLRGSGEMAELAQTKTPGSAETVDLPAFVLDRLRRHIEDRDPPALLFITERGYAVNGTWFTKHFQKLIERAGLPPMTVHDLRSGAATLLAGKNVHPSVARDYLRHANVTTTLTHYTRTSPEQRRIAAQMLDEAIR